MHDMNTLFTRSYFLIINPLELNTYNIFHLFYIVIELYPHKSGFPSFSREIALILGNMEIDILYEV